MCIYVMISSILSVVHNSMIMHPTLPLCTTQFKAGNFVAYLTIYYDHAPLSQDMS
jgi:hypothetical protein